MENLLGFYALIYLARCRMLHEDFYDEEIRVPMFFSGSGDVLYGLAVYGFPISPFGAGRICFLYPERIIIPEAIYTVLITVILYKLLFILNKKLTALEMAEIPLLRK